jgi:hypothetical protein
MKVPCLFLVLAVASLADPVLAAADSITLNFEGILYGISQVHTSTAITDFYAGSTIYSQGTYYGIPNAPGPDYGVTFSPNAYAIALNAEPTTRLSNISRGGLGDPDSQYGALILDGTDPRYINSAPGFTDELSLYYADISGPTTLEIYDGMNGTGSLLGSLTLPATVSNCPTWNYGLVCPFSQASLSFSGFAHSAVFIGSPVLDDVTLGRTDAPIPEPGTLALMLAGALAPLMWFLRRRPLAG